MYKDRSQIGESEIQAVLKDSNWQLKMEEFDTDDRQQNTAGTRRMMQTYNAQYPKTDKRISVNPAQTKKHDL